MDLAYYSNEYASIADINLKKKRRVELTSTRSTHAAGGSPMLNLTRSPTEEELSEFYNSLSQSGTKCAILSLVPGHCNDYIPRVEKGVLPKPLTEKSALNLHCFSKLKMNVKKFLQQLPQ